MLDDVALEHLYLSVLSVVKGMVFFKWYNISIVNKLHHNTLFWDIVGIIKYFYFNLLTYILTITNSGSSRSNVFNLLKL